MTNQKSESYRIRINGMSCGHCTAKAEKAALSVSQVSNIEINLEKKQAIVTGGSPQEVIQAISDAGYPSEILTD